VERARIVLLGDEGVPGTRIAARVAAPSGRWSPGDAATPSGGPAGLDDLPRPGTASALAAQGTPISHATIARWAPTAVAGT
jgi:hypothetical protein